MSQTKLAAATFHFLMASTVAYLTWRKQDFLFDMWALYAAVAVGHSSYDKTMATIKDYKDRKLSAETGPSSKVTTVTESVVNSPPA